MMRSLKRKVFYSLFLSAMAIGLGLGCGEAPPPKEPRALVDGDGDGLASKKFYGRDCDDTNPAIPQPKEIPNNKEDDNCNGQIDEVTLNVGPWVLQVPSPPQNIPPKLRKFLLGIDIRTNPRNYVQYIRCFHFIYPLKSTVNGKTVIVKQALSGFTVGETPFLDNKATLEYTDEKQTGITYKLTAIAVAADKIKGTLRVIDKSKDMKVDVTFNFIGKYTGKQTPAEFQQPQGFCWFCFNSNICPDLEAQQASKK